MKVHRTIPISMKSLKRCDSTLSRKPLEAFVTSPKAIVSILRLMRSSEENV